MLVSLIVYVTKETSVVCFIKETSVCNVDESNISSASNSPKLYQCKSGLDSKS